MRRLAALSVVAVLLAGCGGGRQPASGTATARTAPAPAATFSVGVVGPLELDVPGVAVRRGTLSGLRGERLVLVDARAAAPAAVASVARSRPRSHFALVGASARPFGVQNLAGVVLEEEPAARLAGVTAGLAAVAEAGDAARVAWVGPEERTLAAAFGRGVHAVAPGVAVLHQWSRSIPARCKEAALTALDRDAVVVFAHRGLCAEAAAAAAHDRNLPALRLADFLLPGVAAATIVREAARGVLHGGEDVVFGPASGAIGIRSLDSRIPAAAAAQARAAAQDVAGAVVSAG